MTGQYNEFGRILFHMTKFRALVLLPVQVGLTWLFYHKRFNLAEITVFWLFTMGWIQTIHLVFMPLYFPLIHYKHTIDNFYTISAYLLMFWQGMMLMKTIRWQDVLYWLIIVNIVYLIDFFFQVYLIFGFDVLQHNSYGWGTVWDIIKTRYQW